MYRHIIVNFYRRERDYGVNFERTVRAWRPKDRTPASQLEVSGVIPVKPTAITRVCTVLSPNT